MRAVTLAATMLKIAAAEVAPEGNLPEKPTLGKLVELLEREGPRARMTCLGADRGLLREPEIKLLKRLSRLRASIAHQEDAGALWEASKVGRLTGADVVEFIDVALEVSSLPMFDEIICRQQKTSGDSLAPRS